MIRGFYGPFSFDCGRQINKHSLLKNLMTCHLIGLFLLLWFSLIVMLDRKNSGMFYGLLFVALLLPIILFSICGEFYVFSENLKRFLNCSYKLFVLF